MRRGELDTAQAKALIAELFAEAAEAVEVVRRLWDSWEDDAEIRDAATNRFLDTAKVHHVDFSGEHIAVRGPSIVPRPPQGRRWSPRSIRGRAPLTQDAHATATARREIGEAKGLSLRGVVTTVFDRAVFVGTPRHVADEIDRYVRADACDGFILGSHVSPSGLDEIVDRVVPLLQERGAFRGGYTGATLRENLGPAVVALR